MNHEANDRLWLDDAGIVFDWDGERAASLPIFAQLRADSSDDFLRFHNSAVDALYAATRLLLHGIMALLLLGLWLTDKGISKCARRAE